MNNNDFSTITQPHCLCGINLPYDQCCEPYHAGRAVADTPDRLMRSRYSAFVLRQFNYLITTHHPDYLNGLTEQQLAQGETQWLGLQVLSSKQQSETGEVTFKAWYIEDKHIDAIYECSSFIKKDGLWFYTDGQQMQTRLPGRNDTCICYSGKKFKQCCAKRMS
ncbi:YchJ family protein [Shewanella sp. SG41-4]|uniref:YchJ family protein n=1 Tax=Shewanella sp. SG41-4 TaxID=2760976 RepID=UPI001601F12F|nr:YchJ family protein [Shewanella sp. SG41-4]MBB1439020.1 YchJ family protein [Shewanella sp. SG41-4]